MVPGSGAVARSEKFQTLKIVRPEYPATAIRAGREGVVRLEVHVDSLGKVTDVRNNEGMMGNQDLVDSAVRAVYLWEFKPYLLESGAVPFTVVVPFRYRLVD